MKAKKIQKTKIMYIASLNTKNKKYDGERIKSTYIYDVIRDKYNVFLINLSINKILKTFLFLVEILFRKKQFDYIFISKDPRGANIIHRILILLNYPMSNVFYFEIGPFLYDRIINKSIKFDTFKNDKLIIVETKSMKCELESLGFSNIDVFPNFKQIYHIPFIAFRYPKKILKIVYLSRIEEKKGIYDLIDVVNSINIKEPKYQLDIYGMPQSKDDYEKIYALTKNNNYINYMGKIDTRSIDEYYHLSYYDLHVFPTKYSEGFPGTIIDLFISGVPTLSSTFARAHDILTTTDSIFFEQGNNEDLRKKLLLIHKNQKDLNKLRINTYNRKDDFSIDFFSNYLDLLLNKGELL